MSELQKSIALFIGGIIAGAGEFGIGLSFFLGDVVRNAIFPLAQSSTSKSVVSTYDTGITILMVGLIIINFLIGIFLVYSFSSGFLLGDLFMIAILYRPLSQVAPSVNTHMIIAFIAVLLGMIIKMFLDNRKKGERMSEYF